MYTVAVVDDDLYIGDMLEKALSQAGIRVLRAYSAQRPCCCLNGRNRILSFWI